MYDENRFSDLIIDQYKDPALYNFIEETKKGPKFANYTSERLEQYISRIYELRKNNSNNTAG
jgi:hypothetical protein